MKVHMHFCDESIVVYSGDDHNHIPNQFTIIFTFATCMAHHQSHFDAS